jgi:LPS sulfotransferase NodH
MAEPAGIVIVGSPRSGTTLLRRILDAHPNIACPPETYLLSAAARFLHEETFAQGLRIGVTAGLGFAGFEEDDVLGRIRALVFGFFEEHAQKRGKARWAEKTAFDAFHLGAIRRVVGGHVRFLCLQRHGLDVACSVSDLVDKTGGYVQELHEYVRKYPQPLEAFARAWVDTSSAIADLCAEDELALDLRYEDLARDPEAVVRRVLEFVGEPWEDGMIERALGQADNVGFGDWKTYAKPQIDTSSIDRWKSLPAPTRAHLARICNPTLERLGYEAVAAASDEDAEAARRRYELGLLVNRMKAQKQAQAETGDDD